MEITLDMTKSMENSGINFYYWSAMGSVTLDAQDVVDLIQIGESKFFSKAWGVSVDIYNKFKKHIFDRQCIAITRKGRRCKCGVQGTMDINEFVPGFHDECTLHGNMTKGDRWKRHQ